MGPAARRSYIGCIAGTFAGIAETTMLHYAVVFFVIALIAAVFGFGGIAASAAGIAKILFLVFIVLAVAGLIIGLIKRGR